MKKKLNLIFMLSALSVLLTQCRKEDDFIPTIEDNQANQDESEKFGISKEALGKLIFFDTNLSSPTGQSCGSCHAKNAAFTDFNHAVVTGGIVPGLFGNRNAPSVSYAKFSPSLYFDNVDSTYVGGQFWDGRVNSLKDQAKKPFFNPLEMNNANMAVLANKIKNASYYPKLVKLYGFTNDTTKLLDHVADAIQAFEKTPEVSPFTSKFDYYMKGQVTLTLQEKKGMKLFKTKAKCANCHIIDPDPNNGRILFTDFTYDNIGVPKNPSNPFYTIPSIYNPLGSAFIDNGLGNATGNPDNNGQFKVMTLRNIAITAPYFHNGIYNTLQEVVHFYNKRDVEPFPPAEVLGNVNQDELGDLHLTSQEEADIVKFLETLTDGYKK